MFTELMRSLDKTGVKLRKQFVVFGFCLKSREPCLEKVSTLRDSVGWALVASKFPGIPLGEINPTLSRPVLTSSKMDPATFRAKCGATPHLVPSTPNELVHVFSRTAKCLILLTVPERLGLSTTQVCFAS